MSTTNLMLGAFFMRRTDVRNLRKSYAGGETVKSLAIRYDLTQGVVYKILRNEMYQSSSYSPPVRPLDVINDFGRDKLLELRDGGYSVVDICKIVKENTGYEVNISTMRFHLDSIEIDHAKGCAEALSYEVD